MEKGWKNASGVDERSSILVNSGEGTDRGLELSRGGTILVHLFVDTHPVLVIANRICSYEVNVS